MNEPGAVFLVGAGPGDPGLLTVRAAELLARADVVVHDGLVPPILLERARAGAEKIYAGKKRGGDATLDQRAIEALLIDRARAGKQVVRLKGGDPMIFGRGGEEAAALAAAGIAYEIVPGVSALSAVPAYAGIPLTLRGVARSVAIGSGHEDAGGLDDAALARLATADTVVLFMAATRLERVANALIAGGKPPTTPIAVIRWGTTPQQEVVESTLAAAAAGTASGARPPALVIVGDVVRERTKLDWLHARRPLTGRRVLVTREGGAREPLARKLAQLGADVIYHPVTRTRELGLRPLHDALARGGHRWLVVTSQRAVGPLYVVMTAAGKDARSLANLRVAAVGGATASALSALGLRVDVEGTGGAAALADAILAADPQLAGQKILFPRAANAREELPARLAAAGAIVDAIDVYATEPVPPGDLAAVAAQLREGHVHALVVAAPSQVDALAAALGAGFAPTLSMLRAVAAIGPTTAAALAAHGVASPLVAPTPDALAATLAAHLTEVR